MAREVLQRLNGRRDTLEIPVGVSARHVHLSPEHVETLFGKGYQLTPIRELQPGEYAAKETVTIVGPRGVLQNVRVLGPPRAKTQVEISKTDGFQLGLDPPVRDSGNHVDTPGCVIVGPHGAVKLEQGVICAMRHIHLPSEMAEQLGLKDRDVVRVKTSTGERKVLFEDVLVRVSPNFILEMHVDTDEANAAGLKTGDRVRLAG
ncbi:MAG: phosphate propanoyltransferase [Moorellaceae bacterium]